MKKKIVAILMAMTLTVGACACSKTEETKKKDKKEKEEEVEKTEEEEDTTTTTEEETTTTSEEETTTTSEEDTTTTSDEFSFSLPETDYTKLRNSEAEAFGTQLEEEGYWVLALDADDPDSESDLPSGSYGLYGISLMTGAMVAYIETTEEGMQQYKDNPDMFAGSEVEIKLIEDGDFTYIVGGDAESGFVWGFFDYADNALFFYAGMEENAEEIGKDYASKLGYQF